MSKHTAHNDPALGSYIRFIEHVALSARLDYIKHSRLVCSHEYVMEIPPEVGDGEELLERIPLSLEELSGDSLLCTALRNLTTMEKRVLVLSVLEDKPMEKISGPLHISLGRAYQLRRRALGKLRNALNGGPGHDTV